MILRTLAALLLSLGLAAPAAAAQCGGSFDGFLRQGIGDPRQVQLSVRLTF